MAMTTSTPQPRDADAPRAQFARGAYAWETLGPGRAPAAVLYSAPLDRGREWTADELRALKRDWFREAQANDELRYLRDLAGGLGAAARGRTGPAQAWEGHTGGVAGLGRQRVEVSTERRPDGRERLRVEVGDRTVCDTDRDLFVPGKWLDATRGALPQLERARELEEQRQAAALRAELGLDRHPQPPHHQPRGQALADSLGWGW